MKKSFSSFVLILLSALFAGSAGATPGDLAPDSERAVPRPVPVPEASRRPAPPQTLRRVINKVYDLLDVEVPLDSTVEGTVWESRAFDTSQFNRIGLRVSGEMLAGAIRCVTHWRFTDTDEFRALGPADAVGDIGRIVYSGSRPEYPDGRPDLYLAPTFVAPPFADVYGLRAKVVCRPLSITPVFIGDDSTIPNDPTLGASSNGKLTDVKVLLRLE